MRLRRLPGVLNAAAAAAGLGIVAEQAERSPVGGGSAPEQRIAYATYDTEIFTMAPDGSDRRPLLGRRTNSRPGLRLAWSPDGRSIAYTNGSELWLMRADGSNARRVLSNRRGVLEPSFSPDGRHLRSGKTRRLPRRAIAGVIDATWTPDGRHIGYLRAASLGAPRPTTSLFTVTPSGTELRRIATFEDPQIAGAISWSRVLAPSPGSRRGG